MLKPNCPVCGSPNANGHVGIEYDDLESFEPMECDECGATWNQLWVRGTIEDIQVKEPESIAQSPASEYDWDDLDSQ